MHRSRSAALLVVGILLLIAPFAFARAEGKVADQICFADRVYTDPRFACGQEILDQNGRGTGKISGYKCPCIDTSKVGTVNGHCIAALVCHGDTATDLGGQQQQLKPLTLQDIQKATQGSPSGSTAPSGQQNTLQPQGPNGSILNWAFSPTPLSQQSLIQSNSADNVNEQIQMVGQSPAPSFIQGIENFFSPKSTAESPTGLSGGTMLGVESNSVQTVSTPGAPPLQNYPSTDTFTPTSLDANGNPITPESPNSFQQGYSCRDFDFICKTQVALGFKPASETGAKTTTLSMFNDAQCSWGPCPSTPGVANRDLPAGTLVKITNLDNGKIAIVPVVDRGPYVTGRDLDANPAAARALGLTQQAGLANVSYQVVSSPTEPTGAPTSVFAVDNGNQGGLIQTASASGRFDTALQEGGLYQDVPLAYSGGGIGGEVLASLNNSGTGNAEAAFIAYAQSQQHQDAQTAFNAADSWPQSNVVPNISSTEAQLGTTPQLSYAWNPFTAGPSAGAPPFENTETLPASPVVPVESGGPLAEPIAPHPTIAVENGGPLAEPIVPNPTVAVTSGPLPPAVEVGNNIPIPEAAPVTLPTQAEAQAQIAAEEARIAAAVPMPEQVPVNAQQSVEQAIAAGEVPLPIARPEILVSGIPMPAERPSSDIPLTNTAGGIGSDFASSGGVGIRTVAETSADMNGGWASRTGGAEIIASTADERLQAAAENVPLPPVRPDIVASDIPLPTSRPLDIPLAETSGGKVPDILAANPETDNRLQPAPETPVAQSNPIAPPPADFARNFYELGDKGGDIQGIQKFLNAHGYQVAESGAGSPGKETDVFGGNTLRQVQAFQRDNGLAVDSQVGPQTLAKMNEINTASIPAAAPASPAEPLQGTPAPAEVAGQTPAQPSENVPLPTPRPAEADQSPQRDAAADTQAQKQVAARALLNNSAVASKGLDALQSAGLFGADTAAIKRGVNAAASMKTYAASMGDTLLVSQINKFIGMQNLMGALYAKGDYGALFGMKDQVISRGRTIVETVRNKYGQ